MGRRKQTIVEAAVDGIAFGGRGIARLDGMAVFVDQAVPGDRGLIRITRKRRQFAEARLVELVEASPDRVAAPCRYSGVCGGCTWQFLRYERQIEYKRQHVAESIERIGGIGGVRVHDAIPAEPVFEYRNKMEFTCAERRWLLPEEMGRGEADSGFALGLHVPGTFNKVLDIEQCLLQPSAGNRILEDIRSGIRASGLAVYGLRSHEGFWRFAVLRNSAADGRWMVNLVTAAEEPAALSALALRLTEKFPEIGSLVNNVTARRAGVAVGESERIVWGDGFIRERIEGFEFEISANSFFQTNTRGAAPLYRTVLEYAGLRGSETVLDLYSGTGTIPIFISGHCREVVGIEIAASAVADAERNCRLNDVANCRFIRGDVLEGLAMVERRPEVVIIDPPRVGMAKEVVGRVLAMAPPRLVYVSCNPATLARDLALLGERYEVAEVQPIDMFPHTFHVESVARLERRPLP
ncbi:MAG: 23S rRNA (uracil(1939)-C(5))-methyltransferase RlmD [Desulfobacterales bacterium]